MPVVNSLVPSRFLTLIAHLVIVITIFWSRENNVLACLPLTYTKEQYSSRDTEMIVALSVTLGLFAVELVGFLSGVSMFNNAQSLLSIAAHASAAVALLFFLLEQWACSIYWWIFTFCRSVPQPAPLSTLFPDWPLEGTVRAGLGFSLCSWSVIERIGCFSLTTDPAALCAHCSASICLSFFVFQKWECFTYWYILGFCSALPACIEIILFIAVFGLKKKPL